jgi:hypothetical protein
MKKLLLAMVTFSASVAWAGSTSVDASNSHAGGGQPPGVSLTIQHTTNSGTTVRAQGTNQGAGGETQGSVSITVPLGGDKKK